MYFWISVGVAIALVLVLAWRHDRRRRGSVRPAHGPGTDPAFTEAIAEAEIRRSSHGSGTGSGGIGGP